MQNQHKLNRQSGLTLIELIAALGIAAVIIVGALSLYRNADNAQKTNAILQDMTAIQQSVRALYQGTYSVSDITAALKLVGRWPSSATNMTVTGASDSASYTLTITGVNNSTCAAVMAAAVGWDSVTGIKSGAAPQNMPVSASSIPTECTNTGTASMIFVGK